MSLNWPSKDPEERLDYSINWVQALGSDVIIASDWEINSADLTTDANTYSANATVIWLLAGVINQSYICTNTIETAAGRIFQQSVNIRILGN